MKVKVEFTLYDNNGSQIDTGCEQVAVISIPGINIDANAEIQEITHPLMFLRRFILASYGLMSEKFALDAFGGFFNDKHVCIESPAIEALWRETRYKFEQDNGLSFDFQK